MGFCAEQLEMWLRCVCGLKLAGSHVFDHTLTQRVGLAHRALLPELATGGADPLCTKVPVAVGGLGLSYK